MQEVAKPKRSVRVARGNNKVNDSSFLSALRTFQVHPLFFSYKKKLWFGKSHLHRNLCRKFANFSILWLFRNLQFIFKWYLHSNQYFLLEALPSPLTFSQGTGRRKQRSAGTCLCYSHSISYNFEKTPRGVIAECYENLKAIVNKCHQNKNLAVCIKQDLHIHSKCSESNQTRSADRRGNNVNLRTWNLATNTYFSKLHWYGKCTEYWE